MDDCGEAQTKMNRNGGKNWRFQISDGGAVNARDNEAHADLKLERALRALFFAMQRKDGCAINENFQNVARGHVTPWRVLLRRFKEAKAARNHTHNYPLVKASVRDIDRYVDELFGIRRNDSGEFPKAG